MKPNHPPVDLIRVCELKLGDKVLLSGREYVVTAIDEERVTCKCDWFESKTPQYFKAKSQQKVELVKSKTHDKEKENGLPISENGKVCH